MLTKTRLIRHSGILFVLICAITSYVLLSSQNPLHMDALTEYNHERKKIDIALTNNGFAKIQLLKVQVNDRPSQADVQLVASYDSQLVAGGIDRSENAKFLDIHEMPILPHLSNEEMKRAMDTKDRPINYGIRITSENRIENVEIKYRYFGITKTKKIKLDTWNESNQ